MIESRVNIPFCQNDWLRDALLLRILFGHLRELGFEIHKQVIFAIGFLHYLWILVVACELVSTTLAMEQLLLRILQINRLDWKFSV